MVASSPTTPNPFSQQPAAPPDEQLVSRAVQGDADALELLLRRHQAWIFNLALRMSLDRQDAEDATQEVLMKVTTRLSSFKGDSAFRTWLYRIVKNHVLDRKRSRAEQAVHGFDCYGQYLARASDSDLPAAYLGSPEAQLLIEEARIACLMGMLLCLNREQRLVFVLGELFGASDAIASAILEISREAFRQKLARARQDLYGFMAGNCGLVSPDNPCRCARKTRAFIQDGIVDPKRRVFTQGEVDRVRGVAESRSNALRSLMDAGPAALLQANPFLEPPDIASRLRTLMHDGRLREMFGLER